MDDLQSKLLDDELKTRAKLLPLFAMGSYTTHGIGTITPNGLVPPFMLFNDESKEDLRR